MTGTVSEQLCEIISRPVAADARRRATSHVLDWIACAAIGASDPAGRMFGRHARAQPEGPAIAIGGGWRQADMAAFTNGALGNILEMDDLHRESIVHPGDVVIPAVLAAAQRADCTGARLIDGVIRGYEAAIRIGIAAGTAHYRYWYNSATCGVFGAAAGAGEVIGLAGEAAANAIGLAGMQAAGLWQCRLEAGGAKQLATAHAARAGLLAADLAHSGMAGPRSILEGDLGFFRAMAPQTDPGAALDGPGGDWLIFDTSFKPWPACRHSHPVIELALELRDRLREAGLRPDGIAEATIRTYSAAVDFCDDVAPDTAHRGRFSLKHAFAATVLHGAPDLGFSAPAMLNDPAVAALRRRVTVVEDPAMTRGFPASYPAGLEVALASGETMAATVTTAPGDPENPVGADGMLTKHRMLLGGAGLDEKQIATLETAVAELPKAPDMARLSRALRPLETAPAGEEDSDESG